MDYKALVEELKLQNKVVSITRMHTDTAFEKSKGSCTLAVLGKVMAGEKMYITAQNCVCYGSIKGMGFSDGIPNTPGGFGYFLSYGRGEGFPQGERVKCNPEVSEDLIRRQPTRVMEGFNTIELKPYEETDSPHTVTILTNADQLSALIHIFNFEKSEYDNVIAPMVSGCASVFRIPFGELEKENPRAVIGNIDVFSRPHFDKDSFFFTVSGSDFKNMINVCGESVIQSHIWKNVRARLHKQGVSDTMQ